MTAVYDALTLEELRKHWADLTDEIHHIQEEGDTVPGELLEREQLAGRELSQRKIEESITASTGGSMGDNFNAKRYHPGSRE